MYYNPAMAPDHKRSGKRRVFTKLWNAKTLLEGLQSPNGAFVPTRLPVHLGEEIVLAARLVGVKRPLELPVTIIGRRAPRGASGQLSAGILVRMSVEEHPMKDLLLEFASGKVVDFAARLQPTLRIKVSSRFNSRSELDGELNAMLRDELGLFPVNRQVFIGDRVVSSIGLKKAEPVLELDLVVRGLAHRDNARAFLCEFFNEDERQKSREFMSPASDERQKA